MKIKFETETHEFEELLQKYETICDQFKNNGIKIFAKWIQKWMSEHTAVRAIKWRQYTPSWNDGDACTFALDAVEIFFLDDVDHVALTDDELHNNKGEYVSKNRPGDGPGYTPAGLDPHFAESMITLRTIIEDSESVMQMIFGDDVSVVVTQEGIDVKEYNCGY